MLVLVPSSLASMGADGPPAQVPADFKLSIASFGIAEKPVYTEEVVVRSGRIYVFPSNLKEVTVFEPLRGRLEIIDVARRIQCEITQESLDESMKKLKDSLREKTDQVEKQGGKAKLVEARMARDLFETPLEQSFDAKLQKVKLKNAAVEVDAEGIPETDPARLVFVTTALIGIAQLGAFRAPADLPPFVEFTSIAALTGERKLRPTSMTYLYRLAGPPQKLRRTYRLVSSLTDREVEAISRVDRLREVAPSVRYDQYRLDR